MSDPMIEPVRSEVTVKRAPDQAFRIFTRHIARWWPAATHSVSQDGCEIVVLEERVGGRRYERARGGEEHEWGRVLAWEPPRRIVFSWHPGRGAETAQEVEVRFEEVGADVTRVMLEHRGWEALGDDARAKREDY